MIMSSRFITSSKLTKADLEDWFVIFFQHHLLKIASGALGGVSARAMGSGTVLKCHHGM